MFLNVVGGGNFIPSPNPASPQETLFRAALTPSFVRLTLLCPVSLGPSVNSVSANGVKRKKCGRTQKLPRELYMVIVSEGVSNTGPRLKVSRKKNKASLSFSCNKQVSIMLN